jgi:ABC-type multidrug transport system ATPase subunit
MSERVLAVEGMSRSFGSVSVLSDVTLSFESGSFTGIVGPNGAGKTTLLQVLAGLLPPTGGERSYLGPDAERRIGYLPQQPAFRPGFTVRETLDFYTALADDDPEALLAEVGLADAADRRVEDLSGGMTRLLGLAQAMVGHPPVVMLDEPASGLDPGMRRRTYEVARGLADAGIAVLCTSHDLDRVEDSCDRAVVLDSGEVAADGDPASLRERYDAADLWAVFDAAVTGPADAVEVLA